MEALLRDLRYAVRTLVRTPGWTAMAVLTLAIGTGANAAVFSFVDALLFKQAPGVHPARPLVFVYTSDFSSGPYGVSSYPDYVSLRDDSGAFAALAAIDDSLSAAIRVGDGLERARLARVSGSYFDTLGVRMAEGRAIAAADVSAAAAPVAVIGSALGRRAFPNQPSVVGSVVLLDGRPFTIVGVAPPRFSGIDVGRPIEIWTPLEMRGDTLGRGNRGLRLVGQLAGGISEASARARLDALAARLAADFPATNHGTMDRPDAPRGFEIAPATRLVPNQRALVIRLAVVLTGGVALVLLLACANVTGLLLSRATARSREIAVRRALGAGGWRLLRQFLTESAVLAIASAGVGLIFAAWTADVLASFFPADQASAFDVSPGFRTVLFAVALSAVAALLVTVVPAIRALTPPLAASLRGAAGDITERSGTRIRAALVAGQVAIACVLLVAAALLAQSVYHQLHADFGFATRAALFVDVDVPAGLGEERTRAFYEQARERIAALPGVESAAWARVLPFARAGRRHVVPEGYVAAPLEDLELAYNVVSADYFSALGIAVIAGRAFQATDGPSSPRVAIVNAALAARFFDGRAVGRHLADSRGTALEIVGVVRTGRGVTVTADAPPTVYYAQAQNYAPGPMSLVARTAGRPERLSDAVRRAIQSASADVPIARTITLAGHVDETLTAERLSASIVSACGILAALLAVVGLYGAVAYLVARRTREIGVRIALGAQPRHVLLLVVRNGVGMAIAGLAIGVAAAAGVATLLRSMLYGVGAAGPFTHAAVALALFAVAALAAYVPARRAVRIDPARALSQN
jgi:predicted permease